MLSRRAIATELLLTRRLISANEAERFGLISRVTEPATLLHEAEQLVREILSNSPVAVQLTPEAIHRGLNLTCEESTLRGADYFGLIACTDDFRIGTDAFVNKTRAVWR